MRIIYSATFSHKILPGLMAGVLLCLIYAETSQAQPAAGMTAVSAGSGVASTVPPRPVSPLVSLDVKDAELATVLKSLSKQSGVEIKVEVAVTGKVTIKAEKEPIERLLDRLLGGLGEKNYFMKWEEGRLGKVTILPRFSAAKDSPDIRKTLAANREKHRLLTGREVSFYPGELTIGVWPSKLKGNLISDLESKYGLEEISRSQWGSNIVIKFRILGDRKVFDVIQDVRMNWVEGLGLITPNGLGEKAYEILEEEFQVVRRESMAPIATNDPYKAMMVNNKFLKKGKILPGTDLPITYVEGDFEIFIDSGDRNRINYDTIIDIAEKYEGVLISYSQIEHEHRIKDIYYIHFPKCIGDDATKSTLLLLKSLVESGKSSEFTGVSWLGWVMGSAGTGPAPDDP